MSEISLHVVLPERADDDLSDRLRALTAAAEEALGEEGAYGLGGEHGYGVDYENGVFAMRRFYWGDCDCGYDDAEAEWCDTHKHGNDCYQSELKRRLVARGGTRSNWGSVNRPDECSYDRWRAIEREIMDDLCARHGLDPHFGCAVHCTCNYQKEWLAWSKKHQHRSSCSLELPNFHHKASGLEVRWYKWIGRDNAVHMPEGVNLDAVFAECMASLPHEKARNSR